MSFSQENIDLFERALKDELTPQEKIDFQLSLSDKGFLEDYKTYQILHAGIIKNSREELKNHLGKLESTTSFSDHAELKTTGLYTSKKLWIIIVILIGLFLISYFALTRTKTPDNTKVYLAYYTKFPNIIDPLEKSEQSNSKSLYQYYENGDYEQVEKLAKDSLNNEHVQWFLAMTYLSNSQLNKAEDALTSVMRNNSIYSEHAHWYLALLYIKINRIDESKKLLEELTSSNRNYYKEKSKELLDKI